MTENDRRLLEATSAAIKLLLDTLVRHRFTMVDQEQAQALSAEIGAALAQANDLPEPVVPRPAVSNRPSVVSGWLLEWWLARRVRA